MAIALRGLITIILVLMQSGASLCNERLPSVKDCKGPKSKPIDCRNMGFSNVPYDIFSIPGKM